MRVSQVTSGPLSPPKPREVHSAQRRSSQQAQERERERGRGPEEGSYEAGLSGLMDEHLEHLAQLIARKRALEERKSELQGRLGEAIRAVGLEQERTGARRKELQLEEELAAQRAGLLEKARSEVGRVRRQLEEKRDFAEQEQRFYAQRAEALLARLEAQSRERGGEAARLERAAGETQARKRQLETELEALGARVRELREQTEAKRHLEVSQKTLFTEKRKLLNQLITAESLAGAVVARKAGRQTLAVAHNVNKTLQRR